MITQLKIFEFQRKQFKIMKVFIAKSVEIITVIIDYVLKNKTAVTF